MSAADGDADGGRGGDRGGDRDGGADGAGKTPWLELAIGGCGALLIALMAGHLLLDAFGGAEERPVGIGLEPGELVERGGAWHAPVRVSNLGDRPAAAVELRATLELPSGEVEEAALSVDFLPPRGRVEGAFLFERNPNAGRLSMRAVGYLEP